MTQTIHKLSDRINLYHEHVDVVDPRPNDFTGKWVMRNGHVALVLVVKPDGFNTFYGYGVDLESSKELVWDCSGNHITDRQWDLMNRDMKYVPVEADTVREKLFLSSTDAGE